MNTLKETILEKLRIGKNYQNESVDLFEVESEYGLTLDNTLHYKNNNFDYVLKTYTYEKKSLFDHLSWIISKVTNLKREEKIIEKELKLDGFSDFKNLIISTNFEENGTVYLYRVVNDVYVPIINIIMHNNNNIQNTLSLLYLKNEPNIIDLIHKLLMLIKIHICKALK